MRAASLLFVVCLMAPGCSVRTFGLAPPDAEHGIDAGPPDPGRVDSGPSVDARGTTDTRPTDALVPPPPFDAGTDSGPPPPPDARPPPPPDAGPPMGSVGEGCVSSSDCQPGLMCFASAYIPGGYCTRTCAGDGDCGAWGRCGNFFGYRYCVRRCASSGECRPGYNCSSEGACLPF